MAVVTSCKGFSEHGCPIKFRVMVKTAENATWVGNGLRFDTKSAAQKYATDLRARQLAVTETKIEKTVDIPKTRPTNAELLKRIRVNYKRNFA